MKHLLLILSILLLSSPVIGQSSKYESVKQCVLQTLKENELTGNEMFKMVKEECERILGKVGNRKKKPVVNKKEEGILYRDTPFSKWEESGKKWLRTGDEKTQVKYEGDIVNGVPNGQGTMNFNGEKYVGEYKDGLKHGKGTQYDKNGNILRKWVNGVLQE